MKKRSVILYIVLCTCFFSLMIKIVSINMSLISNAANSQHSKTIEIGSSRGKIYDRNLNLITDQEEKLVAAVTSGVGADLSVFKSDEQYIQELLESGKPFCAEVTTEINNELIRTFSVPIRYSNTFACHITGYLDSTKENGLCGIEKGYNSFLKENSGTLSVNFDVDASGKALVGLDKTINDNNFSSKAGIVLTLKNSVQEIVENALLNSDIESGCAVVMHIDSGEIYALASVPTYDRNDVSESLSKTNSPLVNKALQTYSVGSVFKPIVAAAALESSISKDYTYECTGKIIVGDTTFTCYNDTAHGKENMTQALENSCNTYFINLINQIDTDYLLYVCRSLGFESEIKLASSITAKKSILPSNDELRLNGEKANFSFGQGKLLASPIQILSCYHALASGNKVNPTLLYGFANEKGLVKTQKENETQKIFSNETVLQIRQMLSSVVENGNAQNAKSSLLSLAGKTGTAQSGIYENQKEINRTWFAGFFPAENPHYIVVVLCENGSGGNYDCAPVFKEICEKIALE